MIYGTKAGIDMPRLYRPETLGELYRGLINNHGEVNVQRPVPDQVYRKRHNPLTDVDLPSFRRMPGEIEILSPPRLFRTYGWKCNGNVHLQCDPSWMFQYRYRTPIKDPFQHNQSLWRPFSREPKKVKTVGAFCRIETRNNESTELEFSHGWNYDWMAVRLLTYCYQPCATNHLVFRKPYPVQLKLL